MDRALAETELGAALAEVEVLPTVEELRRMIALAEANAFVERPAVPDDLRRSAWRLHAVAAAGREQYAFEQRQAAFRVSSHILELALSPEPLTPDERLELLVAVTIGYRLGDLDPNAEAVLRRYSAELMEEGSGGWSPSLSLRAALHLVSLRTRDAFRALRGHREALKRLENELGSLDGSTFWPARAIVEGSIGALRFLVFGATDALDQAERWFATVADTELGPSLTERWLGTLLVSLCADFRSASIWTALPEEVPAEVRRALTMTKPSVLLLWPPQRRILGGVDGPSLLDPDVRRAVVAVPTSAGKTLLAMIMVVNQVARSDKSVCFVAPMRSLVREVRGRIRPRLRAVDDDDDLSGTPPDFLAAALREIYGPATVDVVTPERLIALLRKDPQDVLSRYGMFVFDEAHHVGDRGRGFVLEESLSFLHALTADTGHRLILLSAALGNEAQIRSWLANGENVASWSSQWRGPRQLYAVYSADADWDAESDPFHPTPRSLPRRSTPLVGNVRLSIDGLEAPIGARIEEPVGTLVRRQTKAGTWVRDGEASTPQADQIAQIAVMVQHGGPVMTVTGRRNDAQRIAEAIAALRDETAGNELLAELIENRLGATHPLVQTVRKGVAFHHAGLPPEILNAIVDELEADALAHVVCTTTLTDGINLPVHSVVIGEIARGGDRWLTGSRLVNALGRAGRAGLETTGWVIFFAGALDFPEAESQMRPTSVDLQALSLLATDAALTQLRELDVEIEGFEQYIYGDPPDAIRDFASFVWWLAATREQLLLPPAELVESVLGATLGFSQIEPADRERWRRLAERVVGVYDGADGDARKRWATSGLSIGSSRRLDALAERLIHSLGDGGSVDELDPALSLVAESEILDELLRLPEAPSGGSARLFVGDARIVSVHAVVADWVHGTSIPELAAKYLAEDLDDETAQAEMVEAVAQAFEYFLPWALAAVIDEANRRLTESQREIFPPLPLHVRYGVDTAQAVKLLVDGVRSRAIAFAIGRAAVTLEVGVEQLAEWLADQGPAEWTQSFNASPVDVLDLLDVTRAVGQRTLRTLLRGEGVSIDLVDPPEGLIGPVDFRAIADGSLILVSRDLPDLAATVPARQQADLAAVRDAGTPLLATVEDGALVLQLDREPVA